MSEIVFSGVRRMFRRNGEEVAALDGIDLTVNDREFVAIVGPSGCGMTTCLRMVAGLEFPLGGRGFLRAAQWFARPAPSAPWSSSSSPSFRGRLSPRTSSSD